MYPGEEHLSDMVVGRCSRCKAGFTLGEYRASNEICPRCGADWNEFRQASKRKVEVNLDAILDQGPGAQRSDLEVSLFDDPKTERTILGVTMVVVVLGVVVAVAIGVIAVAMAIAAASKAGRKYQQ